MANTGRINLERDQAAPLMAGVWQTATCALLLLFSMISTLVSAQETGCLAELKPFILWADPPYSEGTHDPTATPVPRTIHGLVDVTLRNTGPDGLEVILQQRNSHRREVNQGCMCTCTLFGGPTTTRWSRVGCGHKNPMGATP
jgi:hypothetical protein